MSGGAFVAPDEDLWGDNDWVATPGSLGIAPPPIDDVVLGDPSVYTGHYHGLEQSGTPVDGHMRGRGLVGGAVDEYGNQYLDFGPGRKLYSADTRMKRRAAKQAAQQAAAASGATPASAPVPVAAAPAGSGYAVEHGGAYAMNVGRTYTPEEFAAQAAKRNQFQAKHGITDDMLAHMGDAYGHGYDGGDMAAQSMVHGMSPDELAAWRAKHGVSGRKQGYVLGNTPFAVGGAVGPPWTWPGAAATSIKKGTRTAAHYMLDRALDRTVGSGYDASQPQPVQQPGSSSIHSYCVRSGPFMIQPTAHTTFKTPQPAFAAHMAGGDFDWKDGANAVLGPVGRFFTGGSGSGLFGGALEEQVPQDLPRQPYVPRKRSRDNEYIQRLSGGAPLPMALPQGSLKDLEAAGPNTAPPPSGLLLYNFGARPQDPMEPVAPVPASALKRPRM